MRLEIGRDREHHPSSFSILFQSFSTRRMEKYEDECDAGPEMLNIGSPSCYLVDISFGNSLTVHKLAMKGMPYMCVILGHTRGHAYVSY